MRCARIVKKVFDRINGIKRIFRSRFLGLGNRSVMAERRSLNVRVSATTVAQHRRRKNIFDQILCSGRRIGRVAYSGDMQFPANLQVLALKLEPNIFVSQKGPDEIS